MKIKRMRNAITIITVVILGLVLVSTTGSRHVSAATKTVSNLNDSGPGSLRQAVSDASPGDTIVFSVTGTIVLTTGEIQIGKDLTISGRGAQSLTISGNNATRVFKVMHGTVSIAGLTISNGNANGNVDLTGIGGGILNQDTLTVANSTVSGNQGVNGGGILNGGALTVTNSTISGNFASSSGGGIFNTPVGAATVSNSAIFGNTANGAGGIFNSGSFTLNNSTISGNGANSVGAILNESTANINNSTICGNHSVGGGGAVTSHDTTNIANTIIALNSSSFLPDVSGTFNSLGYNLIGISDGSTGFGATGDQTGSSVSPLDPLVDLDGNGKPLLRDNGGPTDTIGLRYGSPAIDAGDPSSTLTVDQRGFPRPADGNGDSIARIDIGAFEVQREADLLVSLSADKTSVRQGDSLTYTVTVRNFGRGAAQNVVVNDLLSSGTTFVSAMANKGHFTAPPAGKTGAVSWYLGDLLIGNQEAALIQVTVIVRGKTTITNTASATSAIFDPNMANNNASITVSVASGGKK